MARYDNSLLEAALVGYQQEHARITAAIADIQRRLGTSKRETRGPSSTPLTEATTPRKQHRISAAGRARIAEAQRKRWAAAKKAQ